MSNERTDTGNQPVAVDGGNGRPLNPSPPVGAVLVVGGGIAGMQASLDLANSGFKVYLVESLTAIGGKMAQIDKTFPTNDCAMCIVSPKLVDVGRHENIEIITGAQVRALEGEIGHFRAEIHQTPRYVRLDKCTGCGECAAVCPVKVTDEHNVGMSQRRAIFKKYAQAIPGAFVIDKHGESPCRSGCPANVNAHAYVRLIAEGRFAEALAVERRDNPLPAVCGRICPHPCETECSRNELDAPVAICALKRFLTDWEAEHPDQAPPVPEITDRPEKVAILGGGPAGLTAARDLRLQGYQVTIFEALGHLGGMLRYGIPDYRLPPATLEQEIKTAVLDLGVLVQLNTRVGEDVTVNKLRAQGFKAFLLALGAHQGLKLGIPGEEDTTDGIVDAAAFLHDVNAGKEVKLHGKVFVVGGGNVAMDAARTSLRLGADEVTVLYRRAREQMPANPWEIEEAEDEGIRFRLLCNPVRIHHEGGKLRSIECLEMELGEPDASGRRRPVPKAGSEFRVEADFLIPAISQKPELEPLRADVDQMISKWGTLDVDPVTLQSATRDVFAAGDAVSGPKTAVEAIAAGRRAAESIHRHLTGQDLLADRTPRRGQRVQKDVTGLTVSERLHMRELAAEKRKTNFEEVALGYTEEEAVAEAKRCLDCATCCECLACVKACQAGAVHHDDVEQTRQLDVGSVVLAPGFEVFPAGLRPEFGYGHYPNVITSLEFERLLSASGPTEGHVKRPSDHTTPTRVAWIQCVGSRDHSCDRDYCSSVCCMYASKEALIAKEHDRQIEPTVFYIDLRAFGKGFDDYVTRAEDHYGVRYVRSMVSRVIEDPTTGNLEVRYFSGEGERVSEEFDLVVLSVGVQVSEDIKAMARRLNVELDPFGFARTSTFEPVATNRQGVFVCGAFGGPKDIPETVSEASGAAGAAAARLAPSRGTLITAQEYPVERAIPADEDLNIGVFVCHCGINIAAIVDVEDVARYARELPGVTYANNVLYACSQDNQEKMREIIQEQGLNRVIVASCSPRTHEPLFQQTLQQAGLNKYLFDMANIRDQCSWVHRNDNARATDKSKRLLRMAVANVSQAEPLVEREFPVDSNLLVVGGGIAGMTAALLAAEQGFGVYLVERERELGGNLRNLRRTADGADVTKYLEELRETVRSRPEIRVLTGSQVVDQRGYVGNFETEV
ncbi:MAG: FAD-dependent oxidoreductase, partial [bacterium]